MKAGVTLDRATNTVEPYEPLATQEADLPANDDTALPTRDVLGVSVVVSSYEKVAGICIRWARRGESRTVAFANVHVVMEAHDHPEFRGMLNSMDLVNPDGVPLVWSLRALGAKHATRVYGPDATQVLLRAAEDAGIPVGFYGASPAVLAALVASVHKRHPGLKVVFAYSPPFRKLTEEEDVAVGGEICNSGARLLFVGTGCPRQERWIAEHKGTIPAVMLAVGAAFDFIAGSKRQAPRWMMRVGLEWLFRLITEPKRLAGRYLVKNPRFLWLMFLLVSSHKGFTKPSQDHPHSFGAGT